MSGGDGRLCPCSATRARRSKAYGRSLFRGRHGGECRKRLQNARTYWGELMKIAIVGCGDIARAHIRFIVKESRHCIVGLWDADVAKAEALAKTIGIQKVHRTLVE